MNRMTLFRNLAASRPRSVVGSHRDRIAGEALHPWLERMSTLPVFGGEQSDLSQNLPRLHIRRASTKPRRRLAFACYTRHLIHITDYPGIRRADALETLLHEVVHLSSFELRAHDGRFKRTLARAALECFGVDCRFAMKRAVYALDIAIVEAIIAS